jgi:hypothetical protein
MGLCASTLGEWVVFPAGDELFGCHERRGRKEGDDSMRPCTYLAKFHGTPIVAALEGAWMLNLATTIFGDARIYWPAGDLCFCVT